MVERSPCLLYAPESFIRASADVRATVVNGCGPSGWLNRIVPNHLWGLNIKPACNIHDWMYAEGETEEERALADRVFINNLLRLIDEAGGWRWLQNLRRRQALVYYNACRNYGGPYYWSGKNPLNNEILSIAAGTRKDWAYGAV